VTAKPRTTRRRIAELAFVMRAMVDELGAAGSPDVSAHRAALDLVDAFVRGTEPTAAALEEVRNSVASACKRYGASNAGAYRALCSVPMAALLLMVDRGDDESDHVLTYVGYAVPDLDHAGRTRRVEALRAQASVAVAAVDDTPLPPRKIHVAAATRAAESALLERSRTALSGQALALFDLVHPARDARRTADRAALTKRLEELDYPVSEAVLAFEETFGGLLLPTSAFDDWREDRLYTLVGPWAALGGDMSMYPRGGKTAATTRLVPVALGPQDDVYFLDERGAAYYHETIGEPGAVPFGADGAELVTRLVMGVLTIAYSGTSAHGTAVWPPAARVASAAATLGLTRLFADETSEWWAGPAAVVVVMRGMTFGLARTAEALAVLGS